MDSQEAARRWAAYRATTDSTSWVCQATDRRLANPRRRVGGGPVRRRLRVRRSTPFRPPHHGRQGVRDYVTQAFADEQRIDEVRFGTPVVQGDRACVEYWARFLDVARHGDDAGRLRHGPI